ncbi:MAG: hypothetical protein R2798_05275 [Chitinophagales bacterium]|nr:hypothetical protein [Chitinophagales bacterium]
MKVTLIIILFLTLISATLDISMFGLKIGDSQKLLDKIELKVDAKGNDMIKFKTDNGNDFSITCEKGKIVYMENDWLQDTIARQPLFSDFQFGKTTLRDIRKKIGTNGFVYKSKDGFTTDKDLIQFNCFEFDSPNNEILLLVTKLPLTATNITEYNIADSLKLDAIIIADKSYCDKEWGKGKSYDGNYKKIKP